MFAAGVCVHLGNLYQGQPLEYCTIDDTTVDTCRALDNPLVHHTTVCSIVLNLLYSVFFFHRPGDGQVQFSSAPLVYE